MRRGWKGRSGEEGMGKRRGGMEEGREEELR